MFVELGVPFSEARPTVFGPVARTGVLVRSIRPGPKLMNRAAPPPEVVTLESRPVTWPLSMRTPKESVPVVTIVFSLISMTPLNAVLAPAAPLPAVTLIVVPVLVIKLFGPSDLRLAAGIALVTPKIEPTDPAGVTRLEVRSV